MAGPVITDDYVACCICTGVFRANGGTILPYLPIPKTLYCTWGSWAGDLIWQNPSLPAWFTGGSFAYDPNSWAGVTTIPFQKRAVDGYGNCIPTIIDTTAECVVTFNCQGQAGWSVRASNTGGCCLELDESPSFYPGGGGGAYCRIPNVCYGCDGEFSATLTADPNWSDVPGGCSPGVYLWSHNVCDLQTSDCYISE